MSRRLCVRSRSVHVSCDTCGQTPSVVHKVGGSRYCEDCCQSCAERGADTPTNDASHKYIAGPHLCSNCGRFAVLVHVPINQAGRFCAKCCPDCANARASK
jgi:hypothetical protein